MAKSVSYSELLAARRSRLLLLQAPDGSLDWAAGLDWLGADADLYLGRPTDALVDFVRAGTVDVREAFRKAPDRGRLGEFLRHLFRVLPQVTAPFNHRVSAVAAAEAAAALRLHI